MTAGVQAQNATAVIISGRCRDVAQHRAANFSVFARSQTMLGQSSFPRLYAVNEPLVISVPDGDEVFPPVHVQPGDWIIGDEDGVVCVPQKLEERVAELAARGKGVDALCMEDIKAGKGVQVSFKKHRAK